jgi:probable addiction module antidote protein
MTERFSDFDLADLLKTDAAIEVFLADAFETGDSAHIANAIGTVARAKGMTKVAKETGLAREQLYRSLSENGNPTLETTLAVLKSLGFQSTAKQSVA